MDRSGLMCGHHGPKARRRRLGVTLWYCADKQMTKHMKASSPRLSLSKQLQREYMIAKVDCRRDADFNTYRSSHDTAAFIEIMHVLHCQQSYKHILLILSSWQKHAKSSFNQDPQWNSSTHHETSCFQSRTR